MATTKNRRTKSTPKAKATPATPAKPKAKAGSTPLGAVTGNVIVDRRLAFLGSNPVKDVAKQFTGGKSIGQFVEELDRVDRHSQAAYAVKQAVVMSQPKLRLDPNDHKAIKAARSTGDGHSSWVWLACRTGMTPGKVKYIVEGPQA